MLPEILFLLIIAVLVALAARRLHLPYSVGLVAVGISLAATHLAPNLPLTHGLVYEILLPPLLFEAAINIPWPELRRDATLIFTLAIPGTLIAAAFLTLGVHFILHWPLPEAALFGALIAATDPVSVIAMFKDNNITGRLRLLTEAESLFNDGAAAVLFTLALGWGSFTVAHAAETLLLTIGAGILAGALTAALALILTGRTADHLVEATITTVTAYGAFQLAEHFHGSGILASITAGIIIGNRAPREFTLALWDFIAFIANSLIFLLIGISTAHIPFRTLGLPALATILVLVLLSRAVVVYPLSRPFKIPVQDQHVLWWGGLRGALGLALALSLPETLALHDEILIATFAVVAFSVLAQGITMPLLLKNRATAS